MYRCQRNLILQNRPIRKIPQICYVEAVLVNMFKERNYFFNRYQLLFLLTMKSLALP